MENHNLAPCHLQLLLGLLHADNTQPALHILDLGGSANMASGQHVEVVLLFVKRAVLEPENATSAEGNDSHGTVVPDKEGIGGEWDKGLADGGGDGGHEQSKSRNERSHVLGGLGETVFEGRDGSKDLGQGNQDVRGGLGPNVDRGGAVVTAGMSATGRSFIDIVLDDAGADHSHRAHPETGGNLLKGGETNAALPEEGVQDQIAERNEDDQGKGVQIGEDVVGNSVKRHGSSLRGQVVVDLIISDPVEREP